MSELIFLTILLSFLLVLLLRPLAVNLNFTDSPDHRKLHKGNIPLTGGLVIYVSMLVAILLFVQITPEIRDLLLAITAVLAIGILDDKFDINPKIKFFSQLLVALYLAYYSGIQLHYFGNLAGFGELHLGIFSGPVAIFSLIVGMNAFNMLDGIDGLSASLALVCLASLVYLTGSQELQFIGIILISALIVFLLFNLGLFGLKYKIFLGDSGSMIIGLCIAWFLIVASQKSMPDFRPVSAIWIIAIPLIDMTSVMLKRLVRGESMLKADREHLHHKLLDLGLSHSKTLLIITTISMLAIVFGIYLDKSSLPEYVAFYVFLFILVIYNIAHAKFLSGPKADSVNAV